MPNFKNGKLWVITAKSAGFGPQETAPPKGLQRTGDDKNVMNSSPGAKGVQDIVIAMETEKNKNGR